MNAEHIMFHLKAEDKAREAARKLYAIAAFDRSKEDYSRAAMLEREADLHHMAASGTLAFDDCPTCHEVTR